RLPEHTVLGIVKKWCGARTLDHGRKMMRRAFVGCGLVAILVAAVLLANPFAEKSPNPKEPDPPKPLALADFHDLYVLSFGVSDYQTLSKLPTAVKDADDIVATFKKLQ